MFSGDRVGGRSQDQEWPRINAVDYYGNHVDSAGIPVEVMNATIEAALREGTNAGSLLPDYNPSEDRLPASVEVYQAVKVSYKVGTTYRNATNDVPGQLDVSPTVPIFPEIDAIIAPLLTGAGSTAYGVGVAMNVIR